MAYVVREADLLKDRHAIIDLHQKFLTPSADTTRFEWLYCQNPFGGPLVWVAEDTEHSALIGTAAAFPRSMWIGLTKKVGWVLGDFCISGQYRSLGPALQLQRKCLEGVRGTSSIWYDFPSQHMLAIYKRLKILPSGKMIRFVKPLRVNRRVRSWVKGQIWQRGVSGLGNWALKWSTKKVKIKNGLTFHWQAGDYEEEFTQFSENVKGRLGNCLERTANYLNWRYGRNPLNCCELVSARFHGRLKGYVVLAETEGDPILLDLFSDDGQDTVLGLLCHVIDEMRNRGHEALVVSLVDGHIWTPFFRSLGFKSRDSVPIIVQNCLDVPNQIPPENGHVSLLLMQGDRDL